MKLGNVLVQISNGIKLFRKLNGNADQTEKFKTFMSVLGGKGAKT